MSTRREFLEKIAMGGLGGVISTGGAPAFIEELHKNRGKVSLQEAQELHDQCLIIDGHNDTPVERVARGEDVSTMLKVDRDYHTDVPRMNTTGYDGASFIVGNGRIANVWVTMQQTISMAESNPDKVTLVHSSDDFVHARETGKVAMLLSIEGIAKWIMGETDILRMLYRNGIRWVAITHGEGGLGPELQESSNPLYRDMRTGPTYLQGSRSPYSLCTPQERRAELRNALGLTPFGKEVLRVNNELGVVTDLAHINDRAFFDVIELTDHPVIVSHTSVFSLCNHYRNLTDDQIKALAENGGTMGITFVPYFLNENPEQASLQNMMEHIAYVADLVGIEHVGIGTDLDGVTGPIIDDISQLVKVTRAMMEFGFSNNDIKKFWGENHLRVIGENLD